MRNLLLLVFLSVIEILAGSSAQAQTNLCGDDAIRLHDPNFAKQHDIMDQQIKQRLGRQYARTASTFCQTLPGDTAVFPVVVHVMHLGEPVGTGTNISDQQIYEALAKCADDYRNKAGFAPDTKIRFVLAKRDPNGNPSTGITRTNASGIANYATYGVTIGSQTGASYDSVQKLNTWRSDKVINVWIVNKIVGNVAGFTSGSYFTLNEGITIISSQFTKTSYTFAHELGHYLDLYHVYQGQVGLNCPLDSDCTTQGDLVCDTPPILNTDQGTTSSCVSGDATNSTRNFMNYGSTTNRFTVGQTARMWASIYTDYRWPLLSSELLIPPTVTNEAAIVSVVNDASEDVCKTFVPRVMIKNFGNTLNTFTIKVFDGSILVATVPYTAVNLARDSSRIISLPGIAMSTLGFGSHTMHYEISNVNGTAADYLATNNYLCQDIELVRSTFTVTVTNSHSTTTGANTYTCGDTVHLSVMVNTGYSFQKITNGSTTWSTRPDTLFVIDQDYHLAVVTKIDSFQITAGVNDTAYGKTNGSGNYAYGSVITLQAMEKPGGKFRNWTENSVVISTQKNLPMTVTGTRNVVANFDALPTGISPNSLGAVIQVYPNPARDQIHLEIRSVKPQRITIQIVDLLGQVFADQVIAPNTLSVDFDLHMLAPGNYFLRLSGDDGIDVIRFVKQ